MPGPGRQTLWSEPRQGNSPQCHQRRGALEGTVPGRALGLAVANGALLVSTDTGAIVSFGNVHHPSAWILY
ncbi:MAG: hypothetical protein Ct9H300mP32_2260 [Verrucomicrobiota bacterium]|nr:MAG: hypothetical protein Ct9H300mP32_2260 [Verrucomicrobiota bacterium]